MSSSTSSSENPAWGRWLATFLCALALGAIVVFALVILVDPYDSGRFNLAGIKGITDESPRMANVSRGRDPQFNAAVFGNSTGQLLKPAELSQLTGARFVQLTVPGTGPREQIALLRWFVKHHPRADALVIVTDPVWCTDEPEPRVVNPFPFWLYTANDLEYLGRLFNSRALGKMVQRIQLAFGLRKPSPPDGYWDYEQIVPAGFKAQPPAPEPSVPGAGEAKMQFPAIELLRTFLDTLADVPVVVAMPPYFSDYLPPADTHSGARLAVCKAVLAALVAGRAHSSFVDFRVDTALTRDQANFVDPMHYRAQVARRMEQRIAASLRLGKAGPSTF